MISDRIVIIHFAPVEFYPPIQNLLNELKKSILNKKVFVFTLSPANSGLSVFKINSNSIILFRFGVSGTKLSVFRRYWNYLVFYSASLFMLIWLKPKRILYFETISSLPAYVYKRFLNTNCEVLIHYHEYTTPQEYQRGMVLTRYFHQYEKWLYPRSNWISHTNELRMDQFKKDIFPVEIRNAQILPNYPPKNWTSPPKQASTQPLKIVYVGALSLSTMHTEAFANWIIAQQGKVIWDIYSVNFTVDVSKFLKKAECPWIRLIGGVDYSELPSILRSYDIGIILYNGHIPNYIYNAPNKLFEYLACGLNVWFPSEMIGSYEYITNETYPKVVKLDFTNLNSYNLETLVSSGKAAYLKSEFYCESALLPLIAKLTAND